MGVIKEMQATIQTTVKTADKTDESKYTVKEAAKLLCISPITVWREIKRQRLGCYRVCGGRVLLVGRSHIEKYLLESEQAG
jgi:excisionase family DNA binding protein